MTTETTCPDCLAAIPATGGPVHAYIPAPPGCWALYGEVLAREYSDRALWPTHRLTVDAYAAQHPSGDDPRQLQSVTAHLLALHLTLDLGLPEGEVRRRMGAVIRRERRRFERLPAPSFAGVTNVRAVHDARSPEEHRALVARWAAEVWRAWRPAHERIRLLAL